MKAGLFECDHVKEVYRDEHGDYADMFVQLFPELEWRFYDVCNGVLPSNLDECDVYFATGSYKSVYDQEDWIEELKETVRAIAQQDKYFVGFCFGHQLLGEAMGGKVRKSSRGWCVGVHEFDLLEHEPWMNPFQDQLNLLMMCQDQVLELPPDATVLASADKCPVGIFRVGTKMLGIQGHPEYTKAYDRLLLEMRVDRIGQETVQIGRQSFEKDVHQETIRNWILRFIGYLPVESQSA